MKITQTQTTVRQDKYQEINSYQQSCIEATQRLLMLWSSLCSARELASFQHTNIQEAGRFDGDVLPLYMLGDMSLQSLQRYSSLMIFYSVRDRLSEAIRDEIRRWAVGISETGTTPAIICRESGFAVAPGGSHCTVALRKLAAETQSKLIFASESPPATQEPPRHRMNDLNTSESILDEGKMSLLRDAGNPPICLNKVNNPPQRDAQN